MPNYTTIDYLPDLTSSQMVVAQKLTFEKYTPISPLIGWDNFTSYYTTQNYAILYDLFSWQGKAGATYDIYSSSFFDPFILIIYDVYGNTLATDDGSGAYGTDHIEYVAPYNGTYYVSASWHQGEASSNKFVRVAIYEDIDTIPTSTSTQQSSIVDYSNTIKNAPLPIFGGKTAIGTEGKDTLTGTVGGDVFTPKQGDDSISAGLGTDTVVFFGPKSN